MAVLLFALASFVSALLLFLIQPLFARMILPLLGGSPMVWNTALVFYQGALLCGYGYAHLATKWVGPKRQAWLHIGLLALAVFTLPFAVAPGTTPPDTSNPALWQIGLMASAIGIPFFLVSAGAPLLQRWFSHTDHPAAKDPYFLYAASNLGSMVALLGYPFLFEPQFRLAEQSRLWTFGYVAMILIFAACAYVATRAPRTDEAPEETPEDETAGTRLEAPTLRRRARWVGLAFVPSALLMGVTTYLTTDVASFPLLWVVPLTVYLLTFIFAFAKWKPFPYTWLAYPMAPLLLVLLVVFVIPIRNPVTIPATLGLATFFLAALVCHSQLAEDRPDAGRLTEFYFWISLGGVLGGAFCALLAPVVFDSVLEYSLTLIVLAFLLPFRPKKNEPIHNVLDVALPVVVGALLVFMMPWAQNDLNVVEWGNRLRLRADYVGYLGQFLLAMLIVLACIKRPVRFGLGCAMLLFVGTQLQSGREKTLYQERSFFGVLRVARTTAGDEHRLFHGTTLHGVQFTDEQARELPRSYYYPTGPIGQVFVALKDRPGLRVGAVGLGAGTLAAYALPGQDWTYYEIDPDMLEIAKDTRLFWYLEDSKVPIRFELGDARLSMAKTDRQYDLIVLDAYSSDSVPVHLLTKEAMDMYLERLAPGGIIAFHISNRYLKLEPVLAAAAELEGLKTLINYDYVRTDEERMQAKFSSVWVIMAREDEALAPFQNDRWSPLVPEPGFRAWTDDYSSVVSVWRALRRD